MNMNSCPHNISGQSGWVPNPAVSCLLNICPPTSPIPSNGFSSACAIGAASCTPGCNSGYTLSGMYTCTGLAGTKIWTNSSATCTANPCAILPAAVASGNVSGCLATNASKSCSPVCDANYIGNGSYFCNPATSIQNASSWSGSVVCQRNFCTSCPTIANGVNNCSNSTSGAVLTPTCNPAYALTGAPYSNCCCAFSTVVLSCILVMTSRSLLDLFALFSVLFFS